MIWQHQVIKYSSIMLLFIPKCTHCRLGLMQPTLKLEAKVHCRFWQSHVYVSSSQIDQWDKLRLDIQSFIITDIITYYKKTEYDQEWPTAISNYFLINRIKGSNLVFCGFTHAHTKFINIEGANDYDIPGPMRQLCRVSTTAKELDSETSPSSKIWWNNII